MTTAAVTIQNQIYSFLKVMGPATPSTLREYLGYPLDTIKPVIKDQIKKGYLAYKDENKITILRPLSSPGPILTPSEEIRPIANITTAPALDVKPANFYQNPLFPLLPHLIQGVNPSCVGHAVAGLACLKIMEVTGQVPDPYKHITRNINYPLGNFRYDYLYCPIPSPWWIYLAARKYGQMENSYGARGRDAIAILQSVGCVPWFRCLTPKTAPAPAFYSLTGRETYDDLAKIAGPHRIDSWLMGSGFDQTCDIIQAAGAATVDARIFSSITAMGADGRIQIPVIGDLEIGRHQFLFYGFSRVLRLLFYINSWEGFAHHGAMPAEYVDRYTGVSFGIMDRQEPFMEADPPDQVPATDSDLDYPDLLGSLKK